MTPEQQRLVAECLPWLRAESARLASDVLVTREGRDSLYQEALLAVCKAACDFDPGKYPDVPFGAFARLGVRKHMMGFRIRLGIKSRVWGTMPAGDDDEQSFMEPADYRAPTVHPALSAWCDEDAARQRRVLHMRSRLVLYLRYVESWTLEEVGDAFDVSRERVRQIEERAISKLARNRRRKMLAGC